MRGTGVHHFDLVVSDLDRSVEFCRSLLEPLGYNRADDIVGGRGERVVYLGGSGIVPVSLREAQTQGRHDRYRVGIHHVAFEAPSRQIVDERLRWPRERGAQIENDPREYAYMPGYYAGFFYDPDGIKLEIVNVPYSQRRGDTLNRHPYTWLRDERAIPGATTNHHKGAAADLGERLRRRGDRDQRGRQGRRPECRGRHPTLGGSAWVARHWSSTSDV
jgi:glyoxylase I family protein